MKTIIAATDFSAASLNAVNYAADMACMLGMHLILFNVYPMPVVIGEVPIPNYNIGDLQADAENEINRLREKLLTRTGERISIDTVLKTGEILHELAEYCAVIKPHAVVMGAESSGSFERFLFGSETVGALKFMDWPVLIVPPLVTFKNIKKIGLACDFRDVMESVPVQEIRQLVKEFGAELHVLHVKESAVKAFSPAIVEETAMLQDILHDLTPTYDFIHDTDVEKGIIEFAEKNNIDLLVIIPKKHDAITRLFKHSHSKRLVLHTHVPVLSIHE